MRAEDVALLSPLRFDHINSAAATPSSCPIKLLAPNLGRCATPGTLAMRA